MARNNGVQVAVIVFAKLIHSHQRNVTSTASVSCKSIPELTGKVSTIRGPLTLPSLVSYV
jgi:hypothetical protein